MTEDDTATATATDLDLERRIVRQVEYYFGDINLPRDKFLKQQTLLDDGWVPYETMLKFKRLAALTDRPEVITEALANAGSGLVEVSEAGDKIRRSPAMPPPELDDRRRKELADRTLYVKGFPGEGVDLDDLLRFFRDHSDPENLVMRRYSGRDKNSHFKGSVFVTFRKPEDAEAFLAAPSVRYGSVELTRKRQADYFEEKRTRHLDRHADKSNKGGKPERPPVVLPAGSVLVLSGVPETAGRDEVKEAVARLEAEVAYVSVREDGVWVRLQKEDSARGASERAVDGKIKVGDVDVECRLPSEDAERDFLEEMGRELMRRNRSKQKGGNRNAGRKWRGGGGGGGPAAKRKA